MDILMEKGLKFGLMATILGIFCLGVSENSLAVEPATSAKNESPLELKVSQGKVSGTVDNRPVIEILNLLSGEGLFKFKINEELARHPVSGRFEETSLMDTLKRILDPFNILLLSNKEGNPETVFILNLRSGDPSGGPVPAMELTKQQRAAFSDFQKNQDTPAKRPDLFNPQQQVDLSPEMMELFYPPQEPGTEKTGPRSPVTLAMPDFPGEPLSSGEKEATVPPPGENSGKGTPFLSPEDLIVMEKHRVAFEEFQKQSGPPPELFDQFYPKQTPESIKSGPSAK